MVVLVAIVVLLPPTLVLTTLASRWQRQALNFRETFAFEFLARAGMEEARARLSGRDLGLAPGQVSRFRVELEPDVRTDARVERRDDVVLSADGRMLEGLETSGIDLEVTGVDAEGRVVYRFKKLELYVVRVDVTRPARTEAVRLYGVLARLPSGRIETLGVSLKRVFVQPDAERRRPGLRSETAASPAPRRAGSHGSR